MLLHEAMLIGVRGVEGYISPSASPPLPPPTEHSDVSSWNSSARGRVRRTGSASQSALLAGPQDGAGEPSRLAGRGGSPCAPPASIT